MVVDGGSVGCTFWLLLLLLLLLVLVLWLLLLLLCCRLLGGRRCWRGWQLLMVVVVVVGLMGRRSRPTLVRGRRHQRSRLSACCRRLLLPQLPADHGSAIHVRCYAVPRRRSSGVRGGARPPPLPPPLGPIDDEMPDIARRWRGPDANSSPAVPPNPGVAARRARAQKRTRLAHAKNSSATETFANDLEKSWSSLPPFPS